MADNVTRVRTNDTVSRVAVLENQMETIGHNIERLEQKVEGQYETLHSRISDMRDDMHREMGEKHDAVIAKIDASQQASASQHKAIADRVAENEKWRYLLIGGAIVLGYIIAHIKLEKLF